MAKMAALMLILQTLSFRPNLFYCVLTEAGTLIVEGIAVYGFRVEL